MKEVIPIFCYCIPPSSKFFQTDWKIRKFVDEELVKMCKTKRVTVIPTTSLYCLLNTWRTSQYHFGWDANQTYSPPMLWLTFDINCAEYNRVTNYDSGIRKLLETCPYHDHVMSELDDIALDADNPVFEAEPVRIAPIVEQFAFPKVMKWHATVLGFSEMVHETNIVIPKGELSISVSDSTLDGQPAVYCMVTFKSMYATTPRWIKEDIFKQERSIKIDSFPDETHISVGTFPIRYKPALLEVIDGWKGMKALVGWKINRGRSAM